MKALVSLTVVKSRNGDVASLPLRDTCKINQSYEYYFTPFDTYHCIAMFCRLVYILLLTSGCIHSRNFRLWKTATIVENLF